MHIKPLGIGVVGTGDISNAYLGNLSRYDDIVRLVAVADMNTERAQQKARQYSIAATYSSVDELVKDPSVDIVLNLTPPAAHATVTLTALKAGKHVYSEKTIATTLEDGQEILDLAKANGLTVGCAPDTILGGRLQEAIELIDSGKIGEITGGVASAVFPGLEWFHASPVFYYGEGVGPLPDLGPYYLAALIATLGPVARVTGLAKKTYQQRLVHSEPMKGTVIDVEAPTYVTALLEFESGSIVTFLISWDIWDSQLPRMEFYGTKGTICLPDLDPLEGPNIFGGPLWLKTTESSRFVYLPRPEVDMNWESVELHHPFTETSHAQNSRGIGLIDMAYALQEGRAPRLSAEMGFHVLEVCTAITKAAQEKCFVEVKSTCNRPEPMPIDFPKGKPRA